MTRPALAAALALAAVVATASAALYLFADDETNAYYASEPVAEPAAPLDFGGDDADAPIVDFPAGSTDASASARATVEQTARNGGMAFQPIPPADDAWTPAPAWTPPAEGPYRHAEAEDFAGTDPVPVEESASDDSPLADAEREVAALLSDPTQGVSPDDVPGSEELPGQDPNQDPTSLVPSGLPEPGVPAPDFMPCRSPNLVPDPDTCDPTALVPPGDPGENAEGLVPSTDGLAEDLQAQAEGAIASLMGGV